MRERHLGEGVAAEQAARAVQRGALAVTAALRSLRACGVGVGAGGELSSVSRVARDVMSDGGQKGVESERRPVSVRVGGVEGSEFANGRLRV
jgi:hypothetical protein